MATLSQATEKRLGQCRIAEEVLPRWIWEIRCQKRGLAPMPLLQKFEEDIRLLLFDVGVPKFINLRYA